MIADRLPYDDAQVLTIEPDTRSWRSGASSQDRAS